MVRSLDAAGFGVVEGELRGAQPTQFGARDVNACLRQRSPSALMLADTSSTACLTGAAARWA